MLLGLLQLWHTNGSGFMLYCAYDPLYQVRVCQLLPLWMALVHWPPDRQDMRRSLELHVYLKQHAVSMLVQQLDRTACLVSPNHGLLDTKHGSCSSALPYLDNTLEEFNSVNPQICFCYQKSVINLCKH